MSFYFKQRNRPAVYFFILCFYYYFPFFWSETIEVEHSLINLIIGGSDLI